DWSQNGVAIIFRAGIPVVDAQRRTIDTCTSKVATLVSVAGIPVRAAGSGSERRVSDTTARRTRIFRARIAVAQRWCAPPGAKPTLTGRNAVTQITVCLATGTVADGCVSNARRRVARV